MTNNLNDFKLRLIKYINVKTGMLINKDIKRKNEAKDAEWDNRFNNQEFFIYELDENVKINLYKDSVLSRLIYDGFEENESLFIKRFLRKNDIFIDAGCNVGYFSLQASEIVGELGRVVCFEPSPVTFLRLMDNIKLNNFRNIEAVNKGLSDKVGIMDLNISKSGYDAWNTFAKTSDNKFQTVTAVEVSTLDNELAKLDKTKISLIKIDVEGWEKFVLLGGENFFRNFSPVVLVEFTAENTYSAGYFVQEVYDILVNWGYQWFRYSNGELLKEERKLHYPYDNLIATKNIDFLNSKII